jgi:hypothetical protein
MRSAKIYRLTTGAVLLAASQAATAITINLDYSYDTNGFFTDSSRRDLMQSAASYFESRLTDSLSAITSSGGNNMTASFYSPTDGSLTSVSNFSVAADTITIFVGGYAMSGSTLGRGGFGGWSATGTSAFFDTIRHRGQSDDMYGSTATEFNPWGGSISFNTDYSNWYFDSDPSTDEAFSGSDFYSVALHELGHVLGLGTADSWDNLINSSDEFTGTNAVATYSGNVPVTSDGVHWDYGTMSFVDGVAQEAAMDPNVTTGTRKRFTDLDNAALDDIGWDVAATAVPLPPALFLFAGGLLGMLGLGKRQSYA